MDSVEKTTNRSEQKSRKFLKSLIRKQPQELLLVIGTGVSAAVAPGIPALCSWRSCIEAVIEAAEQLEVLHPGDVAEFRRKVTKDGDLLVVAHDLIRKMSPRTGDAKPSFFQDCLMEVFDDLEQHIQNPPVLQSILSLMERGTLVLTTNYDNLLELFGQQQGKPMASLDLKDKTKVRGGRPWWACEGAPCCDGETHRVCVCGVSLTVALGASPCPEAVFRSVVLHGISYETRSFSGHGGTSGMECFTSTAYTPTPAGWCWTLQDIKTSLKTQRSWRFSRTCTAPSPSCSWAAGRRCATRSSRPSSCTRCPTRWSWSTTCWCSRRARTISSSSRRTCCCTASRSCPTGTASTTSQGTCRTSPLRSANSEVQMPIEWTAPRCWGMHARTVQRGS
ncbi:protein FAM118A isoform X2 [Budorcas taxicolor]|uniref:protein FAM118A isoform X2 n=1 Tax=Budorcas taxicolor TaxID=37181 RepID=UPI002284144D|nr:protein FAM118A isoform X2 [Budorcas taxicolor]